MIPIFEFFIKPPFASTEKVISYLPQVFKRGKENQVQFLQVTTIDNTSRYYQTRNLRVGCKSKNTICNAVDKE